METIPASVVDSLSPTEAQAVETWWAGSTEGARCELAKLWDARRDSCMWAEDQDEAGRPHLYCIPMIVTARFHRPDLALPDEEWRADFFEYMMGRPEVYLWEPPLRVFRICFTHQVARSVLMQGKVPADFSCPLGSTDCPMRTLLNVAPNCSLQLGLATLDAGRVGRLAATRRIGLLDPETSIRPSEPIP
jgi:hypothetical protein